MKKYLFYFGSCFNMNFMGELLDEAIKISQTPENIVYFSTCSGTNKMCAYNLGGSHLLCKWCTFCTKKVITKYKSLKYIQLKNYASDDSYISLSFHNAEELRKLKYKNAQIGLGIMSSYISLTRNMSPKMNDSAKRYFEKHVSQNMKFVDALYKMIDDINPDVIYSYNGRFEENRAVFDIGMDLNLKTIMIEDYTNPQNLKKYKMAFINYLPHSIKMRSELLDYNWNHYKLTEEEKINIGKSFYIKRRGGERSGDVKIYIANQKEGLIPNFDNSKRNIAIMNSSEDEYAAVGDEWDSLKLFKTQYDGIIYLLENSPEIFHFYLRIHPNLKDVKYKYHLQLLDLEKKYNNITIIPGNSTYSTYSIMECCEKIVGFGTTMCIESSYWGKPSILLGPAVYYYDNVCYIPNSPDEAIKMLSADLEPKTNINIIKFGAFVMDPSPCAIDSDCQFKYIDFNEKSHKFIKKYTSSPFINFLFGEKTTAFIIAVGRELFCNRKFRMPIEEA